MRATIEVIALAVAWLFQSAPAPVPAGFQELSHNSGVLGAARSYRVLLPAGYEQSRKRYPVVYWMRSEAKPLAARDSRLTAYIATHEMILVESGPFGTNGQFALYFPELVDHIDGKFRTLADRAHRGVGGAGGGGFMAYFLAGKYPDMIGSASSISGTTEGEAGPEAFPVDCRLDDLYNNFDGVRTRLVHSTADSLSFYHRRLASLWTYTRFAFENMTFLAGQDLAEIDQSLDFHTLSFATPLAPPPVFHHVDPYPNFTVWGWEVVSNRKQPGYTVLENVSNAGFRSSVRESIPGGTTIPQVSLSIGSPAIYPPGVPLVVTYVRLIDGKVRREEQRADSHGRLNFDISGDAYEVAVSAGPLLTVSGYTITDANWATAGKPVTLKARFWNKGGLATPGTSTIKWESPNPGVKFDNPLGRLYALTPGETASLPVTFTVNDPARAIVRLVAVSGTLRMPIDVPLFPQAQPWTDIQIADGKSATVFQHAISKGEARFGEGNGDGKVAPGESFAVLVPDSGGLRAAELFTNDPCVESNMRGADSWDAYDHAGANVGYSLPSIRLDCEPGHIIHMLARIVIPSGTDHQVKYGTLEIPVSK